MNTKTYTVRESEIERHWFVVDATDQTLGRLATRVARVLDGKHKPTWTPNLDTGDHVIVLNAGADLGDAATSSRRSSTSATAAIPRASRRRRSASCSSAGPRRSSDGRSRACCPHNRLGAQQLRKLKIYAGSDHPHQAQQPEPLA